MYLLFAVALLVASMRDITILCTRQYTLYVEPMYTVAAVNTLITILYTVYIEAT